MSGGDLAFCVTLESMIRRSTAGLVVMAMLLAGALPCAGWQASAQARHDCCEKGACPDSLRQAAGQPEITQEAADQCCASSEENGQRDKSQSVAAIFVVSPPVASGGVPHADAVPIPRPIRDRNPVPLPAAPLYVLFSVFLV